METLPPIVLMAITIFGAFLLILTILMPFIVWRISSKLTAVNKSLKMIVGYIDNAGSGEKC